jgi:hypothetical protein
MRFLVIRHDRLIPLGRFFISVPQITLAKTTICHRMPKNGNFVGLPAILPFGLVNISCFWHDGFVSTIRLVDLVCKDYCLEARELEEGLLIGRSWGLIPIVPNTNT